MPAEIHENGAENGGFPTLIDLKIAKTLFFTQKYLIRYTVKMFFEEYINFKNFCIGSYIPPQPFGLGLIQRHKRSELGYPGTHFSVLSKKSSEAWGISLLPVGKESVVSSWKRTMSRSQSRVKRKNVHKWLIVRIAGKLNISTLLLYNG
jgi:hypothetical protein